MSRHWSVLSGWLVGKLFGHLAARGAGQVREVVDGVDDLHRRVVAAFAAEHHHAAETVLQVARSEGVRRVAKPG